MSDSAILWTEAHQALLSMGTLQARILEWVAMSSPRRSSQPRDWTQVSRIVGRFCTIWATRETYEYWSGQLIPSLGDLLDPGMEPGSPARQAGSLPAELPRMHCRGAPGLNLDLAATCSVFLLSHWYSRLLETGVQVILGICAKGECRNQDNLPKAKWHVLWCQVNVAAS